MTEATLWLQVDFKALTCLRSHQLVLLVVLVNRHSCAEILICNPNISLPGSKESDERQGSNSSWAPTSDSSLPAESRVNKKHPIMHTHTHKRTHKCCFCSFSRQKLHTVYIYKLSFKDSSGEWGPLCSRIILLWQTDIYCSLNIPKHKAQ